MSESPEQRASLLNDLHDPSSIITVEKDDIEAPGHYLINRISSKLLPLLRLLPSLLKSVLLSCLLSLVPSFVHRHQPSAKPTKLHPTAYLDGLRGVAAFFVFIHHFILDWFPFLSNGYGSTPENTHLVQLPIVRIFYSGRGMVTTFFIISGYVLSNKALSLMHSGRYATLLDSLSSSVFRRGMRLFIPTTISTFISLLLSRAGWYRHDPLNHNLIPQHKDTFFAEFEVWWKYTIAICNPFQVVDGKSMFGHPYDGHLWTIPVEYRGSLVVFLTLLCLAKARSSIRLAILTGLVTFALWKAHWDMSLFLCGTLFADIGFNYAARSDPSFDAPTDLVSRFSTILTSVPTTAKSLLRRAAITTAFVLGLHLLCYPDADANKSPGYATIISHTPQSYFDMGKPQKFSLAVGAILTVSAIANSPALQRPFTTAFAQYLGRISYALYMVHGPVLYTVGMMILLKANTGYKEAADTAGAAQARNAYAWDFGAAAVLNSVLCFWAADWLWRVVDVRAVKIARWVSEWCWVEE